MLRREMDSIFHFTFSRRREWEANKVSSKTLCIFTPYLQQLTRSRAGGQAIQTLPRGKT